jgi:simple sugar transport system ATP-binding protein
VDTIPTEGATKPKLAEMMVGRPVLLEYERLEAERGAERLTLSNVGALSNRGDAGLRDVSFSVHAGEIVGVAGVSGNGQHELAQVITGLRNVTNGQIFIEGEEVTNNNPAQIKNKGIAYIPEERMIDGVIKDFTVAENLVLHDHGKDPYTVGGIFMNFRRIANATLEAIRDYEIKTPSHETPVKNLSGGNIQKLVLARELSQNPRVLIAAQPTRGVDIGATEYIHNRLLEERAKGTAILLISEDLDEIRALSDQVVVMYEGEIVGIVENQSATTEEIGLMMTGVRPEKD